MKLSRLRLRRAPGLDEGLGELRFESGLNVVFGPNESGKSTLARAIQSTLWPDGRAAGAPVDVESEWSDGGEVWSARHDGATVWTRDGELASPPALPGPENSAAYRLHLRDLIADVGDGHADFARRVRAALDGGYDLTRRETPERSRRHGGTEKRELNEAERELYKLEGQRVELGRKVDDLGRLAAELQTAEDARREATLLGRVQHWREAKRELARARAELDADETPDLTGHEHDDLVELDRQLAQIEADRGAQQRALDAATASLRALALPPSPPAAHVMEAWLARADEIADLERAAAAATEAAGRAAAAEARARASLLAEAPDVDALPDADVPLFSPTLAQIDELAVWLDQRAQLDHDRRSLLAQLAALGEEPPAALGLDEEALVRARAAVGERLRARAGWGAPAVCGLVAGAGVAAAAWRGLAPPTSWLVALPEVPAAVWTVALTASALLLGAALGSAGAGLLARRRFGSTLDALGLDADALDALGLDPARPDAEPLFNRLDAALRERRRVADRARERARIDASLRALETRAPELDAQKQRLVDGLGIDPEKGDLTVVEWARRLQAHRDAADALARARADASGATRALDARRTALFDAIAPAVGTPAGLREATGAVRDLQRRVGEAEAARRTISNAEQALATLAERRDVQLERRRTLLERLGLAHEDADGADRRLRAWIEALPARQARQAAVHGAQAVVGELERELAGHEDLMALGEHEIARRREAAESVASQATRLAEAIGAVNREVELAESEDRVEVALARAHEAREALEQRRCEVFEGVAARLLMEDVSEQIGHRQRPEVLTRATELFGLFTRHRYELEVDHEGDGARFVARATETKEKKRLGQLSDGTRMQLLLAARLAFVHQGEHGVHPPLVLDEALSSSDTTRMDAMTDALVAEVGTGRQIFYMTNDRGDVDRWKAACKRAGAPAPHVVDLGEARREDHAGAWEGFEAPAARAPLPKPGQLSAAEYAARLGVPLPDPWEEPGRLHLFHLLADDLELAHRVLDRAHVDRVGPFESGRRTGLAEKLLGADLVDLIAFRATVAERFFALWRRGRGRRLRRGDLDACEALTETYRERLTELAEDVGGDAERFMQRIADKDPLAKGLAEKRRTALEEYLLEGGFLSRETPLADDELVAEVNARLGEGVFRVSSDEAHRRLRDAATLVRIWIGLLRHGDDAA